MKIKICRDLGPSDANFCIWSEEQSDVQLLLVGGLRYSFFVPKGGYKYPYARSAEFVYEALEEPVKPVKPQRRAETWAEYRYRCNDYEQDLAAYKEYKEWRRKHMAIVAWKYEHGGVMLQRGRTCRFDSCAIGYWVISVDVAKERFGKRKTRAQLEEMFDKMMDSEIEYANAILDGSVFGYQILDEEDDVVESCWGFVYPASMKRQEFLDYIVGEAKRALPEGASFELDDTEL